MNIKIYDSDGFGTTSAMLINAYNYVRMMKLRGINIRVTNNSYGGCDEACGYDQATKDAIDALGNAGVLQVFAAGNGAANVDTSPQCPAAYNSPWIISVANSTSTDTKVRGSNFGAVNVDLAAPGTAYPEYAARCNALRKPFRYVYGRASRYGCRCVAAASHNPGLSSASLKATILNSVDVLPAWNGVVKTGGRLNVAQALQNQSVCSLFSNSPISVGTKGGPVSINVTAGTIAIFR